MKNLSSKELNYINDILSWELLAAKKCYQYGCQEGNSAHSQIFMEAAGAHQQNYNSLLSYAAKIGSQGGQVH